MSSEFVNKPFGRVRADWPCVLLPSVAFFQEGPGLRNWQWTKSGMKVINGTNVLTSGAFDVNNTNRFISIDEFHKTYSHFAVEPGDIVVVSSGSIGKVSRVRTEHLPLMMNTSVIRFHSAAPERLDDDYLYAYLRSPLFQNQATSFAIGSAQLNFGPVHIKQMELPLPPIATQRKIAAILSAYDELIENSNRRIKLLEEMSQRIYREWFVDFRSPGHENDPLVDSDLGPIPRGWLVTRLGDRFNVVLGGTPSRSVERYWVSGTVPWINSGRVNDLRVVAGSEMITQEALERSSAKLMPRGSTLVAITGATLGQVSLLEIEACGNQSVVGIYDSANSLTEYLYLTVRGEIGRIISAASGGAQQHINQQNVRETLIFLPAANVAEYFRAQISPIFTLVTNLLNSQRTLRTTRDLLLPSLVSGEIDVTDFDIAMTEATA